MKNKEVILHIEPGPNTPKGKIIVADILYALNKRKDDYSGCFEIQQDEEVECVIRVRKKDEK